MFEDGTQIMFFLAVDVQSIATAGRCDVQDDELRRSGQGSS